PGAATEMSTRTIGGFGALLRLVLGRPRFGLWFSSDIASYWVGRPAAGVHPSEGDSIAGLADRPRAPLLFLDRVLAPPAGDPVEALRALVAVEHPERCLPVTGLAHALERRVHQRPA